VDPFRAKHVWPHLLNWIQQRHFREALQGNWIEAIDLYFAVHPLHVRALQLLEVWDDLQYRSTKAGSYPTFAEWRAQLDAFADRSASPGTVIELKRR